jgi:nitronate monooxygenase
MLHTRLCELLGIEFPIIAAQLGPDLTGPELVAAVSNAGGLGIVQAQLSPPPVLRQELQRLRSMTEKPFGVNFLLPFPSDDTFRVCLDISFAVFV